MDDRKNQRILWLDALRGAAMFWVIYGHTTIDDDIKRYIYSFHMPLFFIISGMTFAFNKENRPLAYTLKKLRTLILPYFLLNALMFPMFYVNVGVGYNDPVSPLKLAWITALSNIDFGSNLPSNATWFLPCLFVTEIMFFFWRMFVKNDKCLIIGVLLAAFTFYAFGMTDEKGGGIWHWETAFTAVVFYMCGYFFMKNINSLKFLINSRKRASIIFVIFLAADGCLLSTRHDKISMMNDLYNNTLYFYVSALMTCTAVILALMLLAEHPKFPKFSAPFTAVGRCTLIYLAVHVPLMKFIEHYTFFGRENEWLKFLMAVGLYVVIYPLAKPLTWGLNRIIALKNKKTGAM